MSRSNSGQIGYRGRHFACFGRRRSRAASNGEKRRRAPIFLLSFVFRLINPVALCVLAFAGWGPDFSRAEQPDFGVYARAVGYCRNVVKRPMALDLDKRVLCFDGAILPETDISLASVLESNGLFVVRSSGGEVSAAMALAATIQDRRATVIVYDYCFSACASYLLVASDKAFVVKDTLVAWHHMTEPHCASLEVSKDGGPKRLEKTICSDTPPEHRRGYEALKNRHDRFYAERVVDPLFEDPPESFTIRKILRSMFEGVGRYPNVGWTWNPRYYASSLKTRIFYEAYPNSQAEVDAMLSKLGLRARVLYDP
jgi:hypothetical protein